jgi:membrane protein implicated in regulation of membrane protease activity
MGRGITRAGYSSLGALALMGAVVFVGAVSVAVQLDGAFWWVLAGLFAVIAVLLFGLSVRLLKRGRLHSHQGGRPAA